MRVEKEKEPEVCTPSPSMRGIADNYKADSNADLEEASPENNASIQGLLSSVDGNARPQVPQMIPTPMGGNHIGTPPNVPTV